MGSRVMGGRRPFKRKWVFAKYTRACETEGTSLTRKLKLQSCPNFIEVLGLNRTPDGGMAKSRTSKSTLIRMIQQADYPVYAVSQGMKIVFCNEILCQITGFDDEFLTSLTCVYQTASDHPPSQQLAAGLCPPPDAFTGSVSEGWISISDASDIHYRAASFVPTRLNGESKSSESGVIIFAHGPPTKHPGKTLHAKEAVDNRELHTAVSQMQYRSASAINIDRLVGISPAAKRLRKQIEVASSSGANAIITGPQGSGRQALASLIHFAHGPEMCGPMIPIDCPLSSMESIQETVKELYRSHKQFPEDPLGRLFLKDVDQLPEQSQRELLGFLQLPDFELPLLATASADVTDRLHPQLWHQLSTLTVKLPSLADRREDIPYLAQAFIEQHNNANRTQISGLDAETQTLLTRYAWPGELDEFMKAIDEACRNAKSSTIGLQDLPHHLKIALRFMEETTPHKKTSLDLDEFLSEIEDELIRRAMLHTDGNKSEAARLLGISRPRLLRRLAQPQEAPDFTEIDTPADEELP